MNPDQGLPSHWGQRQISSKKTIGNQMPDVGRQMWEIGVPKGVECTPWKIEKWAKTKMLKRGTKQNEEGK